MCKYWVVFVLWKRQVIQSGDYSQLNKDSDPHSTSYLLCDLHKLFEFISSSVLMLLASYSCEAK